MKKLILLSLLCSCSSPNIQKFQNDELTKIANRMELIHVDLQQQKLNKDEALQLYEMQTNSIRVLLLTIEGLDKIK